MPLHPRCSVNSAGIRSSARLIPVAGMMLAAILGLTSLIRPTCAQAQEGACCFSADSCLVTLASACTATGAWQGAGTVCSPTPCSPGVCCSPTGGCTVTTAANCSSVIPWLETPASCSPNPCVPIGACCTPSRGCTVTTQAVCDSPATWQGSGTVCAPNPCAKPPTLASYRFDSPDTLPNGDPRPLTREDTVRILTHWVVPNSPQLADSLVVTADFSQLDPGVPGNEAVAGQWVGDGSYRVTYPLSGSVSRVDGSGIRIPLTAFAVTGTTTDRGIEVCLSNHPPEHVSTRLNVLKGAPYRSGDSLLIETTWRSPAGLTLWVWPDLTGIVADTSKGHPIVTSRGGGEFLIRYRLPLDPADFLPEGTGKPLSILAHDAGCGRVANTTLYLDTDVTAPPDKRIRLDPLPVVTTAESLLVSGEAPLSALVLLLRDRTVRNAVEPDSVTGRFQGTLDLTPGENRIQVRAEDEAGNATGLYPTSPIIVSRVESVVFEIATPYSRVDQSSETSDDILLRSPVRMSQVVVRIFNLEGDCLWEESPDADDQFEFRFHWPGTDRSGERAPQGYYLVHAEWRGPDQKVNAVNKGLLLRD